MNKTEAALLDSLALVAEQPIELWTMIMPPWLYRMHCTYLAFSEAWRLYGKTLGYS